MTVCIGAVSQWFPNAQAMVVASDHMLTMGGFMQHEHEASKITFVAPKVCVMLAGDTAAAGSIVERLLSHFRERDNDALGNPSVLDVALATKTFFEDFRQEQIASEVFRPRGITMHQFYQEGLQSQLLPEIAGSIDDLVMQHDPGVEFLVAGVDSSGAHIYTVSNPGVVTNYRQSGYVAIGIGSIHAVQSLIGFRHSAFHGLYETIFEVYASKRRAEAAPGVGLETDLCIIGPHGPSWLYLDKRQLSKLDQLYKEFGQPDRSEIDNKVADLQLFGTEEENEEQANVGEEPSDLAEPVQEAI